MTVALPCFTIILFYLFHTNMFHGPIKNNKVVKIVSPVKKFFFFLSTAQTLPGIVKDGL